MPRQLFRLLLPVLLLVGSAGCEYVRLLRPTVLQQLNPDVVRLVNTLAEMDDPNEVIVARLIGHGGLVTASEGSDGTFHASVVVPEGQFIWRPTAIVMPRGGELQISFHNTDFSPHAAILPSGDGTQLLTLPAHTAGAVRLRLDNPGLYSFDCPVANHAGRGMVGLILVSGEVAREARLDRPPQPRP